MDNLENQRQEAVAERILVFIPAYSCSKQITQVIAQFEGVERYFAEVFLDCLLGARLAHGAKLEGYSTFRTFGKHVFNLLFPAGAGRRLCDLGSGIKLYRVNRRATAQCRGVANSPSAIS